MKFAQHNKNYFIKDKILQLASFFLYHNYKKDG